MIDFFPTWNFQIKAKPAICMTLQKKDQLTIGPDLSFVSPFSARYLPTYLYSIYIHNIAKLAHAPLNTIVYHG